jgi:hypothetical protein
MFRKTFGLIAIAFVLSTGAFDSDLELEPCINGDVSADGLTTVSTAPIE